MIFEEESAIGRKIIRGKKLTCSRVTFGEGRRGRERKRESVRKSEKE